MFVQSDRFGSLDIADDDAIVFPNGIVGFPNDNTFVLLRTREDARIAWLQSTTNAALALPIVSLHNTAVDAPTDAMAEAIINQNIASHIDECAVLLVVTAPAGGNATVNVLAPIVINSSTRMGTQLLLELDTRFLQTPLCLRPETSESNANETTTTSEENANESMGTDANANKREVIAAAE